jgi:hypothetical protein
MRGLIALTGMAVLIMTPGAHASSLNKCIDTQGQVTYSNLPCRNAQEVRTVEIDPAPSSPPARVQAPRPAAEPGPPAAAPKSAGLRLDTQRTAGKPATQASKRQCDAIADKLGSVLDKMDQARRKGYTQEQVNTWNEEIQALERKKQQAGCF